MENLTLNLHYGYIESEDGIHHAFIVTDSKESVDLTEIENKLANTLCTTPENPLFTTNCIKMDLPESIMKRIIAEQTEVNFK